MTLLDKLIQLPMEKVILWDIAYKCLAMGYYSHADFVKFCMANKLPIF